MALLTQTDKKFYVSITQQCILILMNPSYQRQILASSPPSLGLHWATSQCLTNEFQIYCPAMVYDNIRMCMHTFHDCEKKKIDVSPKKIKILETKILIIEKELGLSF